MLPGGSLKGSRISGMLVWHLRVQAYIKDVGPDGLSGAFNSNKTISSAEGGKYYICRS
jgi:hypothetical protein